MLFAEFLGRAHMVGDDGRETAIDLHAIEAFQFGERYVIKTKLGNSYDMDDLETVLSIVHDEFALWRNQLAPEITVESLLFSTRNHVINQDMKVHPRGNGQTFNQHAPVLVVKAFQPNNFVPPPPVAKVVDRVRVAVTMYNITGTWHQFTRGNL